jgi:hypothetical protein
MQRDPREDKTAFCCAQTSGRRNVHSEPKLIQPSYFLASAAPCIWHTEKRDNFMNLTEAVMAEELDAIIRNSTNRLSAERLRLSGLRKCGPASSSAKFNTEMAALERLKAYRSRFA